MFEWIKDHTLEIVCGAMVVALVVALIITIVCAINGTLTEGDVNMINWVANPANPASPVGKIY